PAQLRVLRSDGRVQRPNEPGPATAIGPTAPLKIAYRIEPANARQPVEASLELVATSDARPAVRKTITFVVPRSQAIELFVMPAEEVSKEPMVERSGPGRWQLSTFPGHVTRFEFQLQQHSGQKRRVSVELLGVADETKLPALRELAADRPDRLVQAGAKLLA